MHRIIVDFPEPGGPQTMTFSPRATVRLFLWWNTFKAIGLDIETPAKGCSGMAGFYGHQKRNHDNSRRLFDLSWREALQSEYPVVATGFHVAANPGVWHPGPFGIRLA
jgi:hypothetical protein